VAALGIDVSKADVHCCLLDGAQRAQGSFKNTSAGFRKLIKWQKALGLKNVHACMEATGPYWRPLANALHKAEITVSVVPPNRTSFFARSQLRRTKTDRVDAQMLAEFCQTQKPSLWVPTPPEILELRGFLSYRKQLVQQRTALKQLVAQVCANKALRAVHAAQLDAIEHAIDAIEQQMRKLVQRHPALREGVARLMSIKGVGELTAAAVYANLPVDRLRDGKAAAAYGGINPSERESGTSVHGKPRISKIGNSDLRRDLYMPAIVAMRFNGTLKTFADRLRAKGKPPKLIIVAVMRKLLVLMYTLLKNKTTFNPAMAAKA
jgi:transposase